MYVPYAWAVGGIIESSFGPLNGSVGYVPTLLLIAGYGVALLRRNREAAHGLLIGAGILAASLFFRSIDQVVCSSIPLGTHFLWHLLNGIMLGWMIMVVSRKARLEAAG